MSALTTWGYTLTDVDSIPELMTIAEFNELTAGKYVTDERARGNALAAASAIRNYCGWHVYPSLSCELQTTLYDKAVTASDRMIMIQLPATFVSSIESIRIDGVEYDTYVLMPNGVLRIYDLPWTRMKLWTPMEIRYTAGLPEDAAAGIKELVAHRITHALESSAGIQSETTGGVSITYNANWVNNSRATALADDNKEVLSPYRLRGVF